ncbi:MAG: class I SAM-dependent methyltransferase, partial [Rubrobacteraceae bacterium]
MSETPRVSGARKLPTGEARAHQVREMFDRIAGRYELLNTLTSFGLNRLWNRSIVRASGLKPGGRALDLACGTGSVTRALADRAGPSGYVVGVDFSSEMLNAAKTRPLSNGE